MSGIPDPTQFDDGALNNSEEFGATPIKSQARGSQNMPGKPRTLAMYISKIFCFIFFY